MELAERVKREPYWYHRIKLPGGVTTPGWAPICAEKYAIPDDLTGKRVLDVGAWDGYWTWEALKRGAAEVVAIDDFSDTCGQDIKRNGWATFDLCREALGFKKTDHIWQAPGEAVEIWKNQCNQVVMRFQMSMYDWPSQHFTGIDIAFFFGTLYHLKHPMLALDKLAEILTDDGQLYIESAICDDFSPYHGGLDGGYRNRDMVAEFYPGDQYGNNPGNWWCPTLQCLGYMVESVGFKQVELWRLTENPNSAAQCRGFCWASKAETDVPANVARWRQTAKVLRKGPKVAAVMSVPRLGFNANHEAIYDVLTKCNVSLRHVYGAYWGQSLERGLQTEIDNGADLLVTIDYDTLFQRQDLQELLALMEQCPEAAAIVPWQLKRGGGGPLATMRSKTGQRLLEVPMETFASDVAPIATGHFGLSLFRASALLKMSHPWFLAEPDKDGQWGRDRTDADIYFWRKLTASGGKAYLANRVTVGHLELLATWPDKKMQPIYQMPGDFRERGKPADVWR